MGGGHVVGAGVEEITDIGQGDKEVVHLQLQVLVIGQILLPPIEDEYDGIETRRSTGCMHMPECFKVDCHAGHGSTIDVLYIVLCGKFFQVVDVWVDHKFHELDCKDNLH